MAVPIKMVREREFLYMNAQLKQLLLKRIMFRRDLRSNRKEWLETNRKIIRLTEESKRASWHRPLAGGFPQGTMYHRLVPSAVTIHL